jgi:hypothetical protein
MTITPGNSKKMKRLIIGISIASACFFANATQTQDNQIPRINFSVQTIDLNPEESKKIQDFYCATFSTAYLTVNKSTEYPVLLEIHGGSAQQSGRQEESSWHTVAQKDGDFAADEALPFIGSDFGFHVTNQTQDKITVTVNAHC